MADLPFEPEPVAEEDLEPVARASTRKTGMRARGESRRSEPSLVRETAEPPAVEEDAGPSWRRLR
jgi:hypothetical protein